MRKMKRMTLTGKLTLGGLLIVLVPVLCIGMLSVFRSSSELEAAARSQVAVTARSLSEMVQLALAQEMNMLRELSVGNTIADAAERVAAQGVKASADQIKLAVDRLGTAKKHIGQNYEVILLIDPNGLIFADSDGGSYQGISVSDRDYFTAAKAGKANIGSIIVSKKTGEPVAPLASPVFNGKNETVAVLAVVLKIDYLVHQVTSTKLGSTGYAFLVDGNGQVIAHPKKELILKTNIKTLKGMEEIARSILAGDAGVQYYTFSGEEKVGGYAPVPLAKWSVAATQSLEELKAPIRSMQKQIVYMGSALLAAVLALVFAFGRSISKPIMTAAAGLSDASDQVASASHQVSSSSQQLAEGTSEQAASLEETSSAFEQMASMTKQNAEHAGEANRLMMEAGEVVSKATESMSHLTASMTEISKASEDTQKIIKTIDEIAFQTNLLALNAAVEAARAGEAGAGFAVVADEVRNLAMRAAEAAKNTAALIEGTVKRVKEGSEVVTKTNEEFQKVARTVTMSGELVGEITAASQEQAKGIEQVNRAVAEMDKVVQQNASNAEESASASEEMRSQAEQMKGFVAQLTAFVGGDGGSNRDEHAPSPDGRARSHAAVHHASISRKKLVQSGRGNGDCSAKTAPKSQMAGHELPPERLLPLDDEF